MSVRTIDDASPVRPEPRGEVFDWRKHWHPLNGCPSCGPTRPNPECPALLGPVDVLSPDDGG